MPLEALEDARRAVDRAAEQAQIDERERITGAATRAAVQRTMALRRRSGLGRFAFENGLALAALALFVLSFVGQVVAGRADYNENQRDHGQPAVSYAQYFGTGAFLEATAENWESEFLQMGVFVVLTSFLYQRGSSESKTIEAPDSVDQRPEEASGDPDAPWPVRRGGLALRLYKHSLSIVLFTMFLISLALHAVGGAVAYSEESLAHGGGTVSTVGYLGTSRFWFESFQNWQSEFVSIAAMVWLAVYLRQRGSPESKPVHASHGDHD